jgi:hypothetical protein
LPAPGITLVDELLQLLSSMSARTRRPIRYLQPLGHDSRPLDDIQRVPGAHRVDPFPEVL